MEPGDVPPVRSAAGPIPDHARWEITSRLLAALPVLYDHLFREGDPGGYDERERVVFLELAREAALVAEAYRFPTTDPRGLAATLSDLTRVFFGPDYTSEQGPASPTSAVLMVKRCPFHLKTREFGMKPSCLFHKCLTFSILTIEALNPAYTLRFVRACCMGDRHCEMRIIPRVQAEKEEGSKKGHGKNIA